MLQNRPLAEIIDYGSHAEAAAVVQYLALPAGNVATPHAEHVDNDVVLQNLPLEKITDHESPAEWN